MEKQTFSPIRVAVAAMMLFGIVNFAIAQDNKGPRQGTPPKEAIEICKNKNTGSTCSITTPRGDTLEGTCKNTPDEKYFVCMPERGQQMPPKRQ